MTIRGDEDLPLENLDNQRHLLVIGSERVSPGLSQPYMTNAAVADYLFSLGEGFEELTWAASYQSRPLEGTDLDPRRIRVMPVVTGKKSSYLDVSLRLLLSSSRFSHVLYFLPNPFLAVFPALRRRASRIVVYLANDYQLTIARQHARRLPGWATLFRWSHEVPLRNADAVIARGRRLSRVARRLNPLVHESVPIGHMKPPPPSGSPANHGGSEVHLLYVGRLLPEKGVADLLQALRIIVDETPRLPVVLDIAGQGPELESLVRTARDSGIGQQTVFHGWATADRLNRLYERAKVVIVPSNGFPEGVPRVIDEALVRGIPVVATRAGGISEEFSEDEVCLVEPGKPRDLAGMIRKLLLEPVFRGRFLQGAERRRRLWQVAGSAGEQHLRILLA